MRAFLGCFCVWFFILLYCADLACLCRLLLVWLQVSASLTGKKKSFLLEQMFDKRLSNKCFEQIFEGFFGRSEKVFNRILTEFFNRIRNFFNRIQTESRNYSSGLFPRLALQDLCAAASGLSGSPGLRWSACQGSFSLAPS